ncbi:uncharacterized protein LOC125946398 [Dermacentor silvarum]|uniref:uncharacterized protein LOC125946398 n=1 Tax=Dermacentor silvarum TaxID=543639 RepID=UPI0021015681|nr:uncharacterized protein LOC125946398 [Dermacentor silvarum]
MLCTRRLLQRSVSDEGGGRRRTTTPSRAALQDWLFQAQVVRVIEQHWIYAHTRSTDVFVSSSGVRTCALRRSGTAPAALRSIRPPTVSPQPALELCGLVRKEGSDSEGNKSATSFARGELAPPPTMGPWAE